LAEIEPPSELALMSRLNVVGPTNTTLERLYGISSWVKTWRACYALKGDIGENGQSVAIPGSVINGLSQATPQSWALDIVSEDSYRVTKYIVETIKSYL
jgi:hypothetical protein